MMRLHIKQNRWNHTNYFLPVDISTLCFRYEEIMQSEIGFRFTYVISGDLNLPAQSLWIPLRATRVLEMN